MIKIDYQKFNHGSFLRENIIHFFNGILDGKLATALHSATAKEQLEEMVGQPHGKIAIKLIAGT